MSDRRRAPLRSTRRRCLRAGRACGRLDTPRTRFRPMFVDDIITHLDRTLEVAQFKDYGPNGLQVEGRREVTRVVTGVSANLALIRAAVDRQAGLLVVHHGLIWGGGIERVTGPT